LSLWNCERWKWSQHWIEKESGEWSKISFSYRNPSVYSLCCTIWNRIAWLAHSLLELKTIPKDNVLVNHANDSTAGYFEEEPAVVMLLLDVTTSTSWLESGTTINRGIKDSWRLCCSYLSCRSFHFF
jgi:hypothetical protein